MGTDVADPHSARLDAGPGTLSVLLLEPNEVVRRGIQEMLSLLPPIDGHPIANIGSTNSVESALSSLSTSRVDVLLFPCDIGQGAAGSLIAVAGPARTLALIRNADPAQLMAASQLQVNGFLLESDMTVGVLERTFAQLLAGEIPLPAPLIRQMLGESSTRDVVPTVSGPVLSPREREVLDLLADGLSNKQIARSLRISEHGAKRHVANVLMKLNCPNRTLAVARALRENLVSTGVVAQ